MRSRTLGLLLLSLLIIPNLGCQSWRYTRDCFYYCEPIDEMMLSYNCNRAAKAAWKAREHQHCGRARSDHFGLGFREGYASVAMGGTGCPPPLPHRRYWGWRYQNCEGQECVAAWFDGYPAGARAAEEDGVSNWSRMQTSYLIDAQYAARMPGKSGAAVAPAAMLPGEELEEIPVTSPTHAVPQSAVPTPSAAPVPVDSPASSETPVAPGSGFAPNTETSEEFGTVLRKLDHPEPALTKVERAKAGAAPEVKVVRRIETPIEEPVAIRRFDMPAVEVLSGVSVPKKQLVNVETAPEVEIVDTTPIETVEEGLQETEKEQAALVSAPTLAPISAPTLTPTTTKSSSVVAETPAYSLDGEDSNVEKINVPVPGVKRKPPIVPAQSKKIAPPIVRPVERGRMAKLESTSAAKQASFEESTGEESPVLRRIDLTK